MNITGRSLLGRISILQNVFFTNCFKALVPANTLEIMSAIVDRSVFLSLLVQGDSNTTITSDASRSPCFYSRS